MGTNKPNTRKGAVRKRSQRKAADMAADMAAREIDRLGGTAAARARVGTRLGKSGKD